MRYVILLAVVLTHAMLPSCAQGQPTFFVPLIGGGMVAMGGASTPGPAPLMPMAPMAPLTGGLYSSPGHYGPIAPITPMAPMGMPVCGQRGYASF
jgi:hypothetical protein